MVLPKIGYAQGAAAPAQTRFSGISVPWLSSYMKLTDTSFAPKTRSPKSPDFGGSGYSRWLLLSPDVGRRRTPARMFSHSG